MHPAYRRQRSQIPPDDAELISIKALAFLAEDTERMAQFLNVTGLDADSLRDRVRNHKFLAEILNYLLTDESLLLVFCSNSGIEPSLIGPAQRTLENADRTE
ncbi:hypothetical protein MnTg02_00322 [bacterium MnTg02]|nr:hypothetical protein MnTg02_00322 [bacterium MnTg02]